VGARFPRDTRGPARSIHLHVENSPSGSLPDGSGRRGFDADGNQRVVGRTATAAAGRRLFGGEVRRVPGGAAPGRDDDFVGFAFRHAAGSVACRAHHMHAAARGRAGGGSWTRRTGRSLRAGRARLALRSGRSRWTSIALRTFRRFSARAQSKGQSANYKPAADFHELSEASDQFAHNTSSETELYSSHCRLRRRVLQGRARPRLRPDAPTLSLQADPLRRGAACRIGPEDMKNRLLPTTRPVYDPVAPGKPDSSSRIPADGDRGSRRAIAGCASWPAPGHEIVCNITLLRKGRSE
jgi:hypothetical protein